MCVKTCWGPQQKLHAKRWLAETVPIWSGRRGKMMGNDWTALVAASVFWTCKTEKQHHFHTTKCSKKRPCNSHKNKLKTQFKSAETSRSTHLLLWRLFTHVSAATRGFRSGGYFVVPAYFVFSVQHAAYKFLKFMRIWAMRAPFQKVLAIPLHGWSCSVRTLWPFWICISWRFF